MYSTGEEWKIHWQMYLYESHLPMEEDGIQLPIIAVNLVTANIPYSSNVLDKIHQELAQDPIFKVLMYYINILMA